MVLASKSHATVFVYLRSTRYLSRTNVRLTPLQSLSYPLIIPQLTPLQFPFNRIFIHLQSPNLLPFNHFLTHLHSSDLLPFNRIFIHSQMSNLLPFNPFLTHLQSSDLSSKAQYLTLTNDPLTPYNRLTCPPSNALLIPYKPWPYSHSIDCLSRNNVRLIPLQFHTKVQIYPH